MSVRKFKADDGEIIQIDIPDNATDEQLSSAIQQVTAIRPPKDVVRPVSRLTGSPINIPPIDTTPSPFSGKLRDFLVETGKSYLQAASPVSFQRDPQGNLSGIHFRTGMDSPDVMTPEAIEHIGDLPIPHSIPEALGGILPMLIGGAINPEYLQTASRGVGRGIAASAPQSIRRGSLGGITGSILGYTAGGPHYGALGGSIGAVLGGIPDVVRSAVAGYKASGAADLPLLNPKAVNLLSTARSFMKGGGASDVWEAPSPRMIPPPDVQAGPTYSRAGQPASQPVQTPLLPRPTVLLPPPGEVPQLGQTQFAMPPAAEPSTGMRVISYTDEPQAPLPSGNYPPPEEVSPPTKSNVGTEKPTPKKTSTRDNIGSPSKKGGTKGGASATSSEAPSPRSPRPRRRKYEQ